jgi:cytochrome c biogenesis protein
VLSCPLSFNPLPHTNLTPPPPQVNDFVIDTRPDGSVAQFYSDLTLRDPTGQQLLRKRISVNDPFRYGGVTMYQTDWSLAALTLRLGNTGGSSSSDSSSSSGAASAAAAQLLERLQADSSSSGSGASRAAAAAAAEQGGEQQRSFRLPLASLEGRPGVGEGAKLFATFLPLEPPPQDGRPPRGISSASHYRAHVHVLAPALSPNC